MTEQQIDLQERELDYWMARAYEAEGKLWKAEKRLSAWMEHWNATARTGAVDEVAAVLEANARADQAEARIAEEKHLRMKATAAATKAEARIKAVEDVLDWHPDPRCDQYPDGDPIACGWKHAYADIRHAMEG